MSGPFLFEEDLGGLSGRAKAWAYLRRKCRSKSVGYLGYAFDGHGLEDDGGFGAVHAVAAYLGDLLDDVVAFDDLTKYGVLASEPACVGYGDEELAAVGVGAGVGHG